jgi:hypothetical protein
MQLFNLLSERVPVRVSGPKRCNLHIGSLPLPRQSSQSSNWHHTLGYENLSDYKFGPKLKSHKFCKSCGSSIGIDFNLSAQGEKDPAKDILAINVSNRDFCFSSEFGHLILDHRWGTSKILIWMRWSILSSTGRICCENWKWSALE